MIAIALLALAYFLSFVIRLALSRSREFLADAGSVEITKNPDAMISALRKIEGRGELPGATSAVMEMCIDNPREGFGELFDTHPSVESRVAALVKFAGGHDIGPIALPPPDPDAGVESADEPEGAGPWGSSPKGGSPNVAAGTRETVAPPAGIDLRLVRLPVPGVGIPTASAAICDFPNAFAAEFHRPPIPARAANPAQLAISDCQIASGWRATYVKASKRDPGCVEPLIGENGVTRSAAILWNLLSGYGAAHGGAGSTRDRPWLSQQWSS